MPYFVYDVTLNPETNTKKLAYIETYDKYREAKMRVADERAKREFNENQICRLIHAKNQAEAEALLSAPRDERIIGEDY